MVFNIKHLRHINIIKVEKVEFYRIQQKTILLFSFTLPLTLYLDSYFIVLFDKILAYL